MGFKLKGISFAVCFLTFAGALSAAPRLGLSTNAIGTFNIASGANGSNQTVQAYNLGDGSLNLSATTSASWLTATVGSQTSCPQAAGGCYPISISLNTSTLAPGTYTEYVTLNDPKAVDSPQSIAVSVNTAPVPASLTAYVTPPGGSSPSVTFPIFTSGTGVKGTVTTQSGGNWLQFLSGSGGIIASPAPWLIEVAVQSGQVAGTYTGTVVISGSSVPSDNRTITVTEVVTSAPIISLGANQTLQVVGFTGGSTVQAGVNFVNSVSGTKLSVTGASSSSAFLTASVSGNAVFISANPSGLMPGVYSGTVTIASNAANNSQISIPVELTVAPAGLPMILTGGIINAANYAAEPVSQGDVVAIFGTQFAPSGTFAVNASTPLATTLASTQVLVNGTPAPLYFVGPGQINFQIPYGVAAGQPATVQVIANGMAGNSRSVAINANSPRLLAGFLAGYGAIVNAGDGSLTFPSGTSVPGFTAHPAKPGDTIVIYGVGFGQTTPPAVEGLAAPGVAPLEVIKNVTSTFGGGFNGRATSGNVTFAGLTPTAVGLYQVNVIIPSDTPLGPLVPVSLFVNGVQTNVVYLDISATGK
ncbi:MAG TPA: IPT/TIG domain-containing protein [Bryobacteraceae bacterium]|nr:IPT/TIG domain-containing protein [Bryobacteraceae bacterium]